MRASTSVSEANIPDEIATALFRVVQESLTNAMRHAPLASRIDVRVSVGGTSVDVTVVNDGAGPPTAAIEPGARGGYGIPGLRERAAHVGGTLTAGPDADDAGRWVVRARLPLPEAPLEEEAP